MTTCSEGACAPDDFDEAANSIRSGLAVPPGTRRGSFSNGDAIAAKVHPWTSPVRSAIPATAYIRPAAVQIIVGLAVIPGHVPASAILRNFGVRGMGRVE